MRKTQKAPELEYRMEITPHFNERQQIPTTRVSIETTKQFASFRYELSVRDEVKGKKLRYAIVGLKAPQLSLPSWGTARYVREYENLKGKYEIVVESLDGTANVFTVLITQKRIKVLKSPKNPFIEIVVP